MVNNAAVGVDKFLQILDIFIIDIFYVIGTKMALFVHDDIFLFWWSPACQRLKRSNGGQVIKMECLLG